jgi:hypothetical protein
MGSAPGAAPRVVPGRETAFETDNRDTITCKNLCRATYEPVVSNLVLRSTGQRISGARVTGSSQMRVHR